MGRPVRVCCDRNSSAVTARVRDKNSYHCCFFNDFSKTKHYPLKLGIWGFNDFSEAKNYPLKLGVWCLLRLGTRIRRSRFLTRRGYQGLAGFFRIVVEPCVFVVSVTVM